MRREQERATVLHAAVGIANEVAYSSLSKLDACHEVAKRVLGLADATPAPAFDDENVIDLSRRKNERSGQMSDYDIMRLRCAGAAKAMFGEPEAA